ncbi:MAG TPA: hypothetical protein VFJ29_03930, partial [Candidatus Kapabacteria bacterium]|nr:hypothetical protein [Candidatus Kapabacteria bacterium]
MRGHRYISFATVIVIALLFTQSVYARGGKRAVRQDSQRNTFPYDTTISTRNAVIPQGITTISKDVGMVYVGTSKTDSIAVINPGKSEIIIHDIYTDSTDAAWILGTADRNWTFPDTIQPGDTLWLRFIFAPTDGTGGGLR